MQEKVAALRACFDNYNIDGYYLPRVDEFNNEYMPPYAERLAWLTGFTGSAGSAIVLRDKAAVFVDGRYILQAPEQVDTNLFEVVLVSKQRPEQWPDKGLRLGYDPMLVNEASLKRFGDQDMHPIPGNLIDPLWQDQPPAPSGKVFVHSDEYAGLPSQDKIRNLCKTLRQQNIDAVVLSRLDSICWLLNIRGDEVPFIPVPLCRAIAFADGTVDLYIDQQKIAGVSLGSNVQVKAPDAIGEGLDGKRVLIDQTACPVGILHKLDKASEIIRGSDPCILPKALKNATEIEGMRQAHIRDGAALTEFLAWLDTGIKSGEKITELDTVEKLQACRQVQNLYAGDSFPAITGTGPNGAIIHYKASPETNRTIQQKDIFLVDSGGQYHDGTTDVTRTVCFSEPSAEQKDRYTRVLKGHIAVARARFPAGTCGGQLDASARSALWEIGADYAHGTGHGVGAFLFVHEGPQRISGMQRGDVPLQVGMTLSNEPGYYKDGEYGIRTESVVVVASSSVSGEEGREMLEFETLTMAPICTDLIDTQLLTEAEIDWLNAYHEKVYASLKDRLQPSTAAWLREATQPLS
ncbi:MAG: M24 family metallopeptidase [Alphaproteobacteria bacterium]